MFCKKCGKKMEDGTKFCPHCGASAAASQSVLTPQPSAAPAGGKAGKSGKKAGLFAGIGVAAVLVVAAAAVLLSGVLGGPKAALGKAVNQSLNACQSAFAALELPDMQKLGESKQVRTDVSLQIKDFSGQLTGYSSEMELLKGLGLSVSTGVDLPGRQMDVSASVSYGSAGLLTVWSQASGDILAVGCPELLGGKSYGLSTAALGRDLDKLGAELPEGMEDMSFNLFDILETFSKPVEVDKAAAKALADAVEAEKTGAATMDINGSSLSCTGYHVVVPGEAMLAYISAVEDAYKARELDKDVTDLLRSLGISGEELSQAGEEIRDAVNNREMFDSLREIAGTIGDLELDVYLNGGYVAAVVWEDEIEGERVEMTANFGGGKNYADDLSLELRSGGVRLRWQSAGNHGGENGEYTDSSTFTFQEDGYGTYTLTSQLAYHPKEAVDNFAWTVTGDGFSLTADGTMTAGKDSLFLDLDRLSVSVMGEEMVRLGMTYSVQPYSAPGFSAGSPVMLSAMDENDFEELSYEVAANVQSWALGLLGDVPELAQLFW